MQLSGFQLIMEIEQSVPIPRDNYTIQMNVGCSLIYIVCIAVTAGVIVGCSFKNWAQRIFTSHLTSNFLLVTKLHIDWLGKLSIYLIKIFTSAQLFTEQKRSVNKYVRVVLVTSIRMPSEQLNTINNRNLFESKSIIRS